MCTPTVTERILTLEPTTRDDFADSSEPARAEIVRRPGYRFVPMAAGRPVSASSSSTF